MKYSLSIIIPACNEGKNIPRIATEVIPVLNKLGVDYEIIIVDDGSKDNTLDEAKKLNRHYKNIVIKVHKKNIGLGNAVKTGVKASKKYLIVTMDCDMTFSPKHIPDLLEEFKKDKVDCVIGSPYLRKGDVKTNWYRLFLSKCVNAIYNVLLRQKITAVSPIFRLYKSSQVKKLELKSQGFDINAEILFNLIKDKRRIKEIPVPLTTRVYGESKINTRKEIINHFKIFKKILTWRLFN